MATIKRENIGNKIRELRNNNGLTLKELSERTNLSVSYLSQCERGVTSISITALEKIANALRSDLADFFTLPQKHENLIIRSYEQEVFSVDESRVYNRLTNDSNDKLLEAMMVTLFPNQKEEKIIPYSHEGEEFTYVLEGILTIFIGDEVYQLNPGDCIHMVSTTPHEWANYTNKLVKVLCINIPRIFKQTKK